MKQGIFVLIIFFLFFLGFKCDDECKNDVLDSLNRRVYAFNRGVDKTLLIPSTLIYVTVTPDYIDKLVNNFFINMTEAQDIFLKGIFCDFNSIYLSFSRLTINSTFGLFGVFDLSQNVNLLYEKLNLNLLLKCYNSKYMILPVLGPGTLRMNVCLLFMQVLNPYIYMFNNLLLYYFLEIIVKRSKLMFDSSFFHSSMLDGYSFLKDIYIQNITNLDIDSNVFLDEPGD